MDEDDFKNVKKIDGYTIIKLLGQGSYGIMH